MDKPFLLTQSFVFGNNLQSFLMRDKELKKVPLILSFKIVFFFGQIYVVFRLFSFVIEMWKTSIFCEILRFRLRWNKFIRMDTEIETGGKNYQKQKIIIIIQQDKTAKVVAQINLGKAMEINSVCYRIIASCQLPG